MSTVSTLQPRMRHRSRALRLRRRGPAKRGLVLHLARLVNRLQAFFAIRVELRKLARNRDGLRPMPEHRRAG